LFYGFTRGKGATGDLDIPRYKVNFSGGKRKKGDVGEFVKYNVLLVDMISYAIL